MTPSATPFRMVIIAAFAVASFSLFSCVPSCLTQVPPPCGYNNPYATTLRTTDHFLDSTTARDWIDRYIVNRDSICHNSVGIHSDILPDSSESFNRDIIKELLCIKNCIGIRIYMGMDTTYKVHFLLSGIDPCGNTSYIYRSPFLGLKGLSGSSLTSTTTPQSGMGEMGLKP